MSAIRETSIDNGDRLIYNVDMRLIHWGEMPERFPQEALGHNSKAVHRAYAKRALMEIPSLEDFERQAAVKIAPAA
jgi:hypothetical protein